MSTLYIVATPIGNLQDISVRAIEVLKAVDYLLVEDTRHSILLVQHYGITTPMQALHEHNELARVDWVLSQLESGQTFALISDAGTPLVSDPGYRIVKAVRTAGFNVSPIPGPCALVTALCASGLPTDRFEFIGFLPAKAQAKLRKLEEISGMDHTVILYESTHRLLDTLQKMKTVFGQERQLVLAKELTKQFEHIVEGNAQQLLRWLSDDVVRQKGEFVILVAPVERALETRQISTNIDTLIQQLSDKLKPKDLAKLLSQLTQKDRQTMYTEIMQYRDKNEGEYNVSK